MSLTPSPLELALIADPRPLNPGVANNLVNSTVWRLREAIAKRDDLSLEHQRTLARDKAMSVRLALAGGTQTALELLTELSRDTDRRVADAARATLAQTTTEPPES